jgi:superfamily II DNA or RNA helicase
MIPGKEKSFYSSQDICYKKIPALRGKKVIVFAQHARPLFFLCYHIQQRERKCGRPVPIIYEHFASQHKRPAEIYKHFEKVRVHEDQLCLLVATRRSMSEGVDLPCATAVVFLDLMWSQAPEKQARGRIFRPAQAQARARFATDKYAFYLRIDPAIPTIERIMHDRQVQKNNVITRTLRNANHESTLTSSLADSDLLAVGPEFVRLTNNVYPEQPHATDIQEEMDLKYSHLGAQNKCDNCLPFLNWLLKKGGKI